MVVARMGGERGEQKGEQRWRGRKEGGSGGDGDAGGHQFLDRSRVRILLCENDPKSSQEVLQLLLKCSYQGIILLFSSYGCIGCIRFSNQSLYLVVVKNQKGHICLQMNPLFKGKRRGKSLGKIDSVIN